jgi:hypothetical protein
MDEINVLFESDTTEPTDFEFNGEIITNFGKVSIVDKLPNGAV